MPGFASFSELPFSTLPADVAVETYHLNRSRYHCPVDPVQPGRVNRQPVPPSGLQPTIQPSRHLLDPFGITDGRTSRQPIPPTGLQPTIQPSRRWLDPFGVADGRTSRQPIPPSGEQPTIQPSRHWLDPFKITDGRTSRQPLPPTGFQPNLPRNSVHLDPFGVADGRTSRQPLPPTGEQPTIQFSIRSRVHLDPYPISDGWCWRSLPKPDEVTDLRIGRRRDVWGFVAYHLGFAVRSWSGYTGQEVNLGCPLPRRRGEGGDLLLDRMPYETISPISMPETVVSYTPVAPAVECPVTSRPEEGASYRAGRAEESPSRTARNEESDYRSAKIDEC